MPENIRDRVFQVGEFPVRFFGTNDYFWLSIGRCFAFAEGDECHRSQNSQNSKALVASFKRGVNLAKLAFKEAKKLKSARAIKNNPQNGQRMTKYNFQLIKTSRPVGNVVQSRIPLSELPRCECDPKSPTPCGPNENCLNRMLKYECHPATCPARERCMNQRFVKRQYPKQEPLFTGSRGWGLKTMVDIKKGDFVNEYVGEIIDDEECKRRLELAHVNDVRNFYFLTIEKDRFVD